MPNLIPRSALPGRSRSSHDQIARGLGYFSLALGLAELAAPRSVCRAAGLQDGEGLVRAYGMREIATGVAILASHDATPWIWGRVAGDALDIATVATKAENPTSINTVAALAALAAVAALDAFCAAGLNSEKGDVKTARADYQDRSGFPKGVQSARGAARDFEIPRDMRAPESLRSLGSAGQHQPAPTPRTTVLPEISR